MDDKVLLVRDTLAFKDMQGEKLCQIQEQLLRVKDAVKIEVPDGKALASVKKAVVTPVRDRWTVKIRVGPDLGVQGSILDHEYRIEKGRRKVAAVSNKCFRLRDTYGVKVAEGQNDVLVPAFTVAIDTAAHPTR